MSKAVYYVTVYYVTVYVVIYFVGVGCVYFISILKYRCVYILIISFKSGRISSIFIVHNNFCAKFKFSFR